MSATLSRTLVALAARSLGARRRVWAEAMESELDVAIADGRPLAFAMGCLVAAWRELPALPEGRLAVAAHALAIGLIVPFAGLSLWSGLLGYPYLAFGHVGISGFIAGQSDQVPLLVVGEWGMAPALTLLVLLQSAGQLLLAWFLLERDWARVAAIGCLNAASLATLLVTTSLLDIIDASILLPLAALITEMLAVLALARGHDLLMESPRPARASG